MAALCLLEVLAEVPDPRSRHGRVHPLPAVLALTVLAMLRGCKGPAAIAQFGRDHGAPLAHALGFRRGKTPAASCLSELFSRLDPVAFEAALARWIRSRMPPADPDGAASKQPIAIDGKTLRGSRDGDAPGQHLVAAYAPLVEAVVAQVRVDAKTNEHKAALELLGILPVKGNVFTGDAMFCQRDFCEKVIGGEGDYVLVVKDNQPSLAVDIAAGLAYDEQARRSAAAFSPRRAAAGGARVEDGQQHGQGARAAGEADAAPDCDADEAPGLGGPGAGLRAGARAHGGWQDDGGDRLRDNQPEARGGRRAAPAGPGARALGHRKQTALRQGRDAGRGSKPGAQGQRAAGAGGGA